MWQERFNLGLESNGEMLGSLKQGQQQTALLLALLFVVEHAA